MCYHARWQHWLLIQYMYTQHNSQVTSHDNDATVCRKDSQLDELSRVSTTYSKHVHRFCMCDGDDGHRVYHDADDAHASSTQNVRRRYVGTRDS